MMMVFWVLLLLLLVSTRHLIIEAWALASIGYDPGERLRREASAVAFPRHAPPEPWDENSCYSALIPGVHLTFSFGERLTETRVVTILRAAKQRIRLFIEAGFTRLPVEECLLYSDENRALFMFAKQLKGRFTCSQVQQAIDLLEHCGIAQRHFEEMWAYVFAAKKQVGYIWMARNDLSSYLSNSTATS